MFCLNKWNERNLIIYPSKRYDESQQLLSLIYILEKRVVIQFAPISLLNPLIKSIPGIVKHSSGHRFF